MPRNFRQLEELIVRLTAVASLTAVAIRVIASEWQEYPWSIVIVVVLVATGGAFEAWRRVAAVAEAKGALARTSGSSPARLRTHQRGGRGA
jgi:hypothetical protein